MKEMRSPKALEESHFLARRKRLLKLIRGSVAIFVSAHGTGESHPPSAKDLFYLTGFEEPDSALILLGNSKGPRSILYLRERDPQSERWNGERLGIKRAKKRFAVDEVRDFSKLSDDLRDHLSGINTLHYAPGSNSHIDSAIWRIFRGTPAPRLSAPNILSDSRLLTSELRWVKDKQEIQAIKHACDITARALVETLPRLKDCTSEKHAAQVLESQFTRLGAHGLAFSTIVASGRNATVLHHKPTLQPLWRRELVLFDCGSSFNGYASDISRTVPASGRFTAQQADVYDVVLAARDRAVERAKPGATLDEIHMAAVRQLVRGLIDLGILRGSVSDNVESGNYKPFYMHRTGHWLGLDVHDCSPITNPTESTLPLPAQLRPLVPGCVFTIEPGLYFDLKDDSIPVEYRGIGIRIEDDLHITVDGSEILSNLAPLQRDEIEALFP